MGRADGAERRGQLALHGVARGLASGGEHRERTQSNLDANIDAAALIVRPGFVRGTTPACPPGEAGRKGSMIGVRQTCPATTRASP